MTIDGHLHPQITGSGSTGDGHLHPDVRGTGHLTAGTTPTPVFDGRRLQVFGAGRRRHHVRRPSLLERTRALVARLLGRPKPIDVGLHTTLQAQGQVSVQGVAAVDVGAATVQAYAHVRVAGAIVAVVPAPELLASATVEHLAQADGLQTGRVDAVARAEVACRGEAALSDGPATLLAQGTFLSAAEGVLTIGAVNLAASARVDLPAASGAVGRLELIGVSVDATATATIEAPVSVPLAAPTCEATGTVDLVAQGPVSIPAPALVASGSVVYAGTGAPDVGSVVCQASATVTPPRQLPVGPVAQPRRESWFPRLRRSRRPVVVQDAAQQARLRAQIEAEDLALLGFGDDSLLLM